MPMGNGFLCVKCDWVYLYEPQVTQAQVDDERARAAAAPVDRSEDVYNGAFSREGATGP